jgi:hypothetical protein
MNCGRRNDFFERIVDAGSKQINHQEFSFLRSQKFKNMRRKITQARPDGKYSQEEYLVGIRSTEKVGIA